MLNTFVVTTGGSIMFKISDKIKNEFGQIFNTHRLQNSACNVFFQNIRLLNNRHKLLDRDTYKKYYFDKLNDIELVSSPIDSFVPCDDVDNTCLFTVNQLVPEYETIAKRVTLDNLYDTLPLTHEVHMKLKENPSLLSTVVDDIFIYFSIFKYLNKIDEIRIHEFSNMTPIIEYIVKNISIEDLKNFLITKRVNKDKYVKYCEDILFNPDVTHTHKFYSVPHGDIPEINVIDLLMRLTTNIIVKSDVYIIIGIYMTLSFAISDIINKNIDDSPCVTYVRDVLSKL